MQRNRVAELNIEKHAVSDLNNITIVSVNLCIDIIALVDFFYRAECAVPNCFIIVITCKNDAITFSDSYELMVSIRTYGYSFAMSVESSLNVAIDLLNPPFAYKFSKVTRLCNTTG